MDAAQHVYAHSATSVKEMGDIMHPYLGREMIAQIFTWREVKPHRITLAAIGGQNVAFWFKGVRYVRPIIDVFGQGVTQVLPEDRNESSSIKGERGI